jgi:type IV secretory pathway TrbD component
MSDFDEGYEVPIHRSLTEPILLAGLPREIALIYWTLAAAFVLGAGIPWLALPAIALHLLGVAFTKSDPYFFKFLNEGRKARNQRRLEP